MSVIISALARVNDFALTSLTGDGDTTIARVQRLLDAASWPYGLTSSTGTTYGHQSTNLASDRLGECYLTAASAGLLFRSDRYGHAYLGTEFSTSTVTAISESTLITADTLAIGDDDGLILNVLTLATANGVEQTFTDDVSVGHYGRYTGGRDDLNLSIGTDLTFLATPELAKGRISLRPLSFEFANTNAHALAQSIDLDQLITLTTADAVIFTSFRVAALHVELAPLGADDVSWTTTVSVAPASTSTVTLP